MIDKSKNIQIYFKSIFGELFYFGLIALAFSIPLSLFFTSFFQFWLLGAWILSFNFKEKLSRLMKNKVALAIIALFFIHIIGLFWTSDFEYALHDIKIKLPLLSIPFLLGSWDPLPNAKYYSVLKSLLFSVYIGTIVCAINYFGFWYYSKNSLNEISIFISHIRFSLLICFVIFIQLYFLLNFKNQSIISFWLNIIGIIWLIFFIVILKSITGFLVLFGLLIFLLIYLILKCNSFKIKLIYILFLIIIPIFFSLYIYSIFSEYKGNREISCNNMDKFTPDGNLYSYDLKNKQKENGNLIWVYIQRDELEREWNKRSSINFNERDKKDNLIYSTLIRFLTSKGLRKDAESLKKITDYEVSLIENGTTNIKYPYNVISLNSKIYEIIWGIDSYIINDNPNGNTVIQRFEYCKTALEIIKSNFLTGVGTGDVKSSFLKQYDIDKSNLIPELRLRAHNQYLTICIAFGLLGGLYFIFALILPFFINSNSKHFLYITFFIIITLSMIAEDTLESQTGITMTIFFMCYLLFLKSTKKKI